MEKLTILLLAKQVKNGKRRTRMKSAEGSLFGQIFAKKMTWNTVTQRCTKVINHCPCAVRWASLRPHSFRSGQTLSPARKKKRKDNGKSTETLPCWIGFNSKIICGWISYCQRGDTWMVAGLNFGFPLRFWDAAGAHDLYSERSWNQ